MTRNKKSLKISISNTSCIRQWENIHPKIKIKNEITTYLCDLLVLPIA